jgi:hypothetical protein
MKVHCNANRVRKQYTARPLACLALSCLFLALFCLACVLSSLFLPCLVMQKIISPWQTFLLAPLKKLCDLPPKSLENRATCPRVRVRKGTGKGKGRG